MKIEFRVWDNDNNKYFEPIYRAYKGELEELLMQPSGKLLLRKIEKGIEALYGESLFPDRFVVEQFTGMTNKHKQRVYVGDAIGHIDNIVENHNGNYCINGDRPLLFFFSEKVVGNRHERVAKNV